MQARLIERIHPMVGYILSFLLGSSMLFLVDSQTDLGEWRGILVSYPLQNHQSYSSSIYFMKKEHGEFCLLHEDPFYLYRRSGDTAGILLPRRKESLRVIREVLKGRVKITDQALTKPLCSRRDLRVIYD